MPEFQFSERHRIWVDASPEAALAAAREVGLAEMPLARLLIRIRGMRTLARGGISRSTFFQVAGCGDEKKRPRGN